MEGAHTPQGYAECDNLQPKIRKHHHVLRVDVPKRCVPPQRIKIDVLAYTALLRGDANLWSRDRLKVRGLRDLK